MEDMVTSPGTPTRDFWNGRRVLLTGHTGFKGAWLSLWLMELGAEVFGFSDKVPTERSLFEDADLAKLLHDRRGDIRDMAALEAVMAEANPDIVLHLAAQPLVRLSYNDPVHTFATNVMGTVNVLELARKHGEGIPVLVVTSDKCYENRDHLWGYRENEAMGGYDPYSASKGCAELVVSAYGRSFMGSNTGFKVVSGRAGNVFGGGDWAVDRLVPDLIRALSNGLTTPIRNPGAIRPWQHVLEPLCGYLLLVEAMMKGGNVLGEGWNFGPDADAEVSVGEVADTVCRLWGRTDGWRFVGIPDQLHEASVLRLDSTKARVHLGWTPRWKLAEGLAATIEVYSSESLGADLQQLLRRQIQQFVHRTQHHLTLSVA